MIEVLSREEVEELTRYKRPKEQMQQLAEMGVPATLLRDTTVRVLRAHLTNPNTTAAGQISAPRRKSAGR
jgi:hypothetical protein